MLHVKIRFLAPFRLVHVSELGTHQHQRQTTIRERANTSRRSPDLSVGSLHSIIGPDPAPMLPRKVHECKGLNNRSLNFFGSLIKLYVLQSPRSGFEWIRPALIALINPGRCEAYLLPIVSEGDLEGLFIE